MGSLDHTGSCGGARRGWVLNLGFGGRWEREESRFGASVTGRVELLFTEMGVMRSGVEGQGFAFELVIVHLTGDVE